MKLEDIIKKNEEAICEKWLQLIFKLYPPEVSKFFIQKKDQFENPVGYIISKETKNLFKELINDFNPEIFINSLDEIIKINSIQPVSPSHAIGFIFELKNAIRYTIKNEIIEYGLHNKITDFESKIDKLALHAFDCYMNIREKIFNIKIKESKAMTFKLVDRININQKKLKKIINQNDKDK